MNKLLLAMLLFFSVLGFAQNEQLAQYYFEKGDFEKAKVGYEELLKAQKSNSNYFQKLVDCYQQLEQYDWSEKLIKDRLEKYKQSNLIVELGFNYQLQKNEVAAKKQYELAIEKIKKNPNEAYPVAAAFERKALLDYALKAYETALAIEPESNFNFQMALLYGQMGKTDLMIDKFLTEAYTHPQNSIMIQNQLSRFMSEALDVTFNDNLRKALIVRTQKNQDVFWNQFLSWYYVQQKEYGKAFIQEKAIYKRNPETFSNIVNLAQLAIDENETETAKEILNFVIENTQDIELLIQADTFLIKMRIKDAKPKDYKAIENDLEILLKKYGISPYSLTLQLVQSHFLTFNLNQPELSKAILKKALDLPLNQYEIASVKMELADVFLYEQKFNQALIYYSQIEEDLKNDVVGHEATLKSAKTSYFKGDFTWASKQFKELKSASTQLIANDALEYFLLINDNTVADSTQTALKQFAHADYLLYQSKTAEAQIEFQNILDKFKGQEIESITLLRLAKIDEKEGNYISALSRYKTITDSFGDGIYADEALYFSAEIYNNKLNDYETSKGLYEQIIFQHQDSIYFTAARKKYRQIRGDTSL